MGHENRLFVGIDWLASSDRDPKPKLRNVLFHEAGHVHNNDVVRTQAMSSSIGLLHQIDALAEFYQDHPERFENIVIKKYGSSEGLIADIQTIVDFTQKSTANLPVWVR